MKKGEKQVINLNKIIPPWDYLKIVESLVGKKYGYGKEEFFKIEPEIKIFEETFKVPLNFPYQGTFEQMGSGSVLRDFDRRSGEEFTIESRIILGIPDLGWIYDIPQLLWTSNFCEWGIVECCHKFQLFVKRGFEGLEIIKRWEFLNKEKQDAMSDL